MRTYHGIARKTARPTRFRGIDETHMGGTGFASVFLNALAKPVAHCIPSQGWPARLAMPPLRSIAFADVERISSVDAPRSTVRVPGE